MDKNTIEIAQRVIDLQKYLPPVLQEVREYKTIAKCENPVLENLWSAIDKVLKDQFILDSTKNGVRHWEKMLLLSPKDTETLDVRKTRILARLNETLPYTYRRLERWLVTVCGKDKFVMKLKNEIYWLDLRFFSLDIAFLNEIYGEVRKMIPANLGVTQSILHKEEAIPLFVGMVVKIGTKVIISPYQPRKVHAMVQMDTGMTIKYGLRIRIGT